MNSLFDLAGALHSQYRVNGGETSRVNCARVTTEATPQGQLPFVTNILIEERQRFTKHLLLVFLVTGRVFLIFEFN